MKNRRLRQPFISRTEYRVEEFCGKAYSSTVGESRWRARPMLLITVAMLMLLAFLPLKNGIGTVSAEAAGQWYKTDTHVHSSVSSDGYADIGINSLGQSLGYNALFLTDHNGGSNYPARSTGATVNHVTFEDSYMGWPAGTYGTIGSTTNALTSNPHHTGNNSVHMATTSSSYGETFVYTQRGPNYRNGDIIIKVSIYPVRIDPGSGLDVSVSIGEDPTVVRNPTGYTTQAGVVSPGKSTVLIWQLGTTRSPSSDPNARVLTYPLGSYTLNTWNNYTINVTNALNDIPLADRPMDYTGLSRLKMTAAGNNGTADAYFDTYSIDALTPETPQSEYIYRTGVIDDFNTSNFVIVPSYEMGKSKHTNRFDFGIVQASQYVSYTNGSDGILPTEQGGYPAQLNHPGFTITDAETVSTQAHGADIMEVRDPNHIVDWDAILQQGVQVIGSWSADLHDGMAVGKPATYIYAPSLGLDDLMHSLYEGRVYNALNNFSGRLIFNLSTASVEPFAARYPVFVPASQSTANAHLQITTGLFSGDRVYWLVNGTALPGEPPSGGGYNVTKSISLSSSTTYVRVEANTSSGTRRAMTQAIFFVKVPSLPAGMSYYVDRVTTSDNKDYTKLKTKGITASSWNATNSLLSVTLTDPANALVSLRVTTPSSPVSVAVDGTNSPQAASLAAFQAATNSTWFFDSGAALLYVKALHATSVADVVVNFSGAPLPTATPTTAGAPTNTLTNTPTSTPVVATSTPGIPMNTRTATLTATQTSTRTPTNPPGPTNTPTVTSTPTDTPTPPPGGSPLFSDGFESGNLSLWSQTSQMVVQQQEIFTGLYAARGTTTGAAAYAMKQLPSPQTDVFYRMRFKIVSQGANWAYVERFRTAGGTPLIGVYVTQSTVGKLGYRNDVTGASTTSSITVTRGAWHDLQVHLHVDTATGTGFTETWFDGNFVPALSKSEGVGTTATGKLQLGDAGGGYARDIAFDDIAAATGFVGP
ncbi:MAG: hypothetical protein ABI670_04575 [Chloroflexota bacterium]